MRLYGRLRLFFLSILIVGLTGASVQAAQISNRTLLFYDSAHGTQVEYFGSNGVSFLWYPGNRVVVQGRWKIATGENKVQNICFSYGENTYNPVTGHRGSGWQCRPLGNFFVHFVEDARGDVFGLAKRQQVPYILPTARTTIAKLRKGPSTPVAPPQTANAACAEILAKANTSPANMSRAGMLYYHGKHMGQKCIKVDYERAFDLLRQANDGRNFNSLLRDLESRASTGNPRAVNALRRLKLKPMMVLPF